GKHLPCHLTWSANDGRSPGNVGVFLASGASAQEPYSTSFNQSGHLETSTTSEELMASVKAIPQGYTTVTPSMTVKDAPKVIEFYKKAFGATERARMPGPDGKIMHAEIQIGSSIIMITDEVRASR